MLIDVLFSPEEFSMYRNAMGLTMQQVADEFLVTKQSISQFENGLITTDSTIQYYTIGILTLWGRYEFTDEERAWRLECGRLGINVGTKRNRKMVEYVKEHMTNEIGF